MRLLANPNLSFVPTLTSVAVGLSIVATVGAILRLNAAVQLKKCREKGELTNHIVATILLQRDLLSHLGVPLNQAAPDASAVATHDASKLPDASAVATHDASKLPDA